MSDDMRCETSSSRDRDDRGRPRRRRHTRSLPTATTIAMTVAGRALTMSRRAMATRGDARGAGEGRSSEGRPRARATTRTARTTRGRLSRARGAEHRLDELYVGGQAVREARELELAIGESTIRLETGRVGLQANGAVLARGRDDAVHDGVRVERLYGRWVVRAVDGELRGAVFGGWKDVGRVQEARPAGSERTRR